MTRYENAHQELNLTHLADPLARIAAVLAEVSTELEQLSERVGASGSPASGDEDLAASTQRSTGGPEAPRKPSGTLSSTGNPSGIEVVSASPLRHRRGEPVDTSFARPPAGPDSAAEPDSSARADASIASTASAVGASPFNADRRVGLAGWQRWRGRASPALWVSSTVLLLGVVMLLLLLAQR